MAESKQRENRGLLFRKGADGLFPKVLILRGPFEYLGVCRKHKHPELKDQVIVPDVLIRPHNASLEMTFYEGRQFPREYQRDIFAAEHGSWNRSVRTGYEIIRVPLKNGRATGKYEDFLTGFVTPEG